MSGTQALLPILGAVLGSLAGAFAARFSGKGLARLVLYGAALGPFALRGLTPGSTPLALAWAGCLGFLVLASALTDISCRRVPDCLTLTGLALAFIFNMASGAGPGAALRSCLLGALSGGGLLWLSGLILGGLGGGDVKLGLALGAFLGWTGTLVALLFASLTAALVSLALLALGRARLRDGIPFGPYLALGAVLAVYLGPRFFSWLGGL